MGDTTFVNPILEFKRLATTPVPTTHSITHLIAKVMFINSVTEYKPGHRVLSVKLWDVDDAIVTVPFFDDCVPLWSDDITIGDIVYLPYLQGRITPKGTHEWVATLLTVPVKASPEELAADAIQDLVHL